MLLPLQDETKSKKNVQNWKQEHHQQDDDEDADESCRFTDDDHVLDVLRKAVFQVEDELGHTR